MRIGESSRNRKGMKRAAIVTVLLTLMLSLMSVILPAAGFVVNAEDDPGAKENAVQSEPLAETGEAVKSSGGTLVAPVGDLNAEPPKLSAKGAVLYSLDLDKVVYAKNGDKKLEPYSTTKLLTCLLALEKLDPDKVVTISEEGARVYEGGTTIWLKEGEKIKVIDLIYGAMLESGNDAAYSLGEAVSGSQSAFADLMNETIAEWGCKDTHFVNPNGWKHKDQYTTAHDMAIITAKCLENKQLRDITITKKYTIPETNLTEARELTNYFLSVTGKIDALTGGKTGTWEDDDCGLAAEFSEGGLTEVAVVLGDTKKGRPKDLRKLIEFSHQVTPGFAVPAAGAVIDTAWVRHGDKTRLDLVSDGTTYAYPAENRAKDIMTVIKYDKLEAPIKKGDAVGELQVYSDDNLVGEHKLIASEDIAVGWLPSYIYISNKATLNILKAFGIIAALILLLVLLNKRYRSRKDGASDSGKIAAGGGSSRKEKREARKRLREKYRNKH